MRYLLKIFAFASLGFLFTANTAFAQLGDRIACPAPHQLIDVFQSVGQDDRWRDTPLWLFNVVGAKASSVLITRLPVALPPKSNLRVAPVVEFVKEMYLESDDKAGLYRSEPRRKYVPITPTTYRRKDSMFGYNPCKKYVDDLDYNAGDPRGSRALYNYCANQHILNFRSDPKIIIDWRGKPKNLTPDFCQKMWMLPVKKQEEEFRVEEYLKRAAATVGVVPQASKTSIRTLEERAGLPKGYPTISELACKHPDDEADQIREKEKKKQKWKNRCGPTGPDDEFDPGEGENYERIYDPSHPFSPRFDFDYNERERYNPLAALYGYGESEPECAVACAVVPVDVMRFRRWKFGGFSLDAGKGGCMSCRLMTNLVFFGLEVFFGVPPDVARRHVPCSTRFDLPDNEPSACRKCGSITSCCEYVRKPVPGINTLKLRPFNPQNFPYGAAEGMRFSEWFGNHQPYMRWWDTGTQANPTDRAYNGTGSDPYALEGSLDTIVGVGQDGKARVTGRTCRYGGDGERISIRDNDGPRPNTSWAETKLYQARTIQKWKLACIGRYEMLYKLDSAEDLVLNRSGAQYQTTEFGGALDRNWPYSWQGYAGAVPFAQSFPMGKRLNPKYVSFNLDNAKPGDVLVYDQYFTFVGVKPRLPHVSYVTEANNKLTYSKRSDTERIQCDYVKVVDYNYGKYPDVCGSTDARGFGPERTIYKPGSCVYTDPETKAVSTGDFPKDLEKRFKDKNVLTRTCDDPNLESCSEPLWPRVLIFSPIGRFAP